MDCKKTLCQLFEQTGNIQYYLMWKAIGDDERDAKR